MSDYVEAVASGRPMLTDAATGTRLRLETGLRLDPILDIASLADSGNVAPLRAVAGEYAAIAEAVGLPIELDTMSYWASPDHLHAAGRPGDLAAVNRACVEAIAPLRRPGGRFVAGVIGPRADGYRPSEVMSVDEAAEYHRPQARALAEAGVDLLLASTMSAVDEACGLSMALAHTGVPYVVAAVLTSSGTLPDGTPLAEMIDRIDGLPVRPPEHYLLSCTHPLDAMEGLSAVRAGGHEVTERLIGIKANGSRADAAEREGTGVVLSDPPRQWTAAMMALRDEFGFRVLGGCCGTDGRHLLALALALSDPS